MIRIITDSTCNLTKEVAQSFNIKIAPVMIIMDGKRRDDTDIPADEYYDILTRDDIPKTEPPSAQKFIELIRDGVMNGIEEFIIITMSSTISDTYYLALTAKKKFELSNRVQGVRIHVVDSLCIGSGSGYLVMKVAMMRDEGATYEELISFINKYKTRIKHMLSISDMDTLVKGKKMSITKAKLGKLFGVEAIIENKRGNGTVVNKVRGRINVIKYFTDEFIKTVDTKNTNFIIAGYTSDVTYAKELREYLFKNTDFRGEIYVMQTGLTIGVYIGLGGLSLHYVTKSGAPVVGLFQRLIYRNKEVI